MPSLLLLQQQRQQQPNNQRLQGAQLAQRAINRLKHRQLHKLRLGHLLLPLQRHRQQALLQPQRQQTLLHKVQQHQAQLHPHPLSTVKRPRLQAQLPRRHQLPSKKSAGRAFAVQESLLAPQKLIKLSVIAPQMTGGVILPGPCTAVAGEGQHRDRQHKRSR